MLTDIEDTQSSFGKRTLLFVDDADFLDDRCAAVLAKARPPLPPIVIACSDYWAQNLRALHAVVVPRAIVTLDRIPGQQIISHLGSTSDWERRMAFEVNGDLRQFLLRRQLGGMTKAKDAHFDTMWDRARFLMSDARDIAAQIARNEAFGQHDLSAELLFESYPKAMDTLARNAHIAEVFSAAPKRHNFLTVEAQFVLANIVHATHNVTPTFPKQLMECESRMRRGKAARRRIDIPHILGGGKMGRK